MSLASSTSTSPSVNAPRVAALAMMLLLACASAVQAQPPGPELFGKPPTTPLELWDAADYLVRTGQAAQAVPYLNRFMQSNPDDETLMRIRDRYGSRSILRLQDYPETRALAEPLARKLGEATRRYATRPDRIARFIGELAGSREEQDYAVERLRDAGPFAVPALLQALDAPSLSPEAHALMVRNMGRLDRSAVPALVAALDPAAVAAKPNLAADAAEVLGQIADPRAIPALTALGGTVDPNVSVLARDAARRAVERITGRAFEQQPSVPAKLLTDEACGYHRHAVRFPGETVVVWVWDPAQQVPAPQTLTRSDAEAYFGLGLSRAALAIDPTYRSAQVVAVGIALEKSVERVGFERDPAADPAMAGPFSTALAAGPAVLGEVLCSAICNDKDALAAVAAEALGRVTDANGLPAAGTSSPLVEALAAPGRRARFAAAKALVLLDPHKGFPGSSRVVPTLLPFVSTQAAPRALVIDGNTARGSQLGGYLHTLGYDPVLAQTGDEGFRIAADSADIELILIDHHLIAGDWRLHDTLANLRNDARTSGVPTYIVGPLGREVDLHGLLTERFPGVKFLVTPPDAPMLARELAVAGQPAPLSPAERANFARDAAALLAAIATRPNSPYECDLAQAERPLAIALNVPETSLSSSIALGDVPDQAAQRGLADALIDPSRSREQRLVAADQLARSIRLYGPLVAAAQEVQLLNAFDREADPALRNALGAVIGALRPRADVVGARLRQLGTSTPNVDVPPASPSPEAAPSPAPVPEANP